MIDNASELIDRNELIDNRVEVTDKLFEVNDNPSKLTEEFNRAL